MFTPFSSFLKQDIIGLIKHHWKQLLGMSLVIWFVLFLLNLFLGTSFYIHSFWEWVKDKLGMYFYIKDDVDTQSITYKKVVSLQTDLAKQGIKSSFSSKDDAMKFLESKLPNVMDNFNKFWVENSLPSTIYVMFRSQSEYEALKTTLLNYKDIILNMKDVANNIETQENRTLSLINIVNFVWWLLVTVAIILIWIILALLWALTILFTKYFKKQIELRHLLGWFVHETAKEFSFIHLDLLVISFIICGLLVLFGRAILWVSLHHSLSVSFGSFVKQPTTLLVLWSIILEIIFFFAFSYWFSYFYIKQQLKKLW